MKYRRLNPAHDGKTHLVYVAAAETIDELDALLEDESKTSDLGCRMDLLRTVARCSLAAVEILDGLEQAWTNNAALPEVWPLGSHQAPLGMPQDAIDIMDRVMQALRPMLTQASSRLAAPRVRCQNGGQHTFCPIVFF